MGTTATIPNAAGAFGSPIEAVIAQLDVVEAVNGSGGTRQTGDVVCLTAGAPTDGVTAVTTTTVNDRTVWGVVGPRAQGGTAANADQYVSGAVMPVIVKGTARINVGANAPAQADVLTTSGVAGVAITNAGAPAANAVVGSLIGIVLSATKDANNCVLAYVSKF